MVYYHYQNAQQVLYYCALAHMILSEKNNVESVHHLSHSVTTKEGTNTNIAFHVERYKLSVYGPLLGMTLVGQTLCLHLGVSVFGCSILVEWGGGGNCGI